MAIRRPSSDSTPEPGIREIGGGAVRVAGMTLTVQRIARDAWAPGVVLRSWGAAPLQVEDGAVLVPCAADEVLWIGAWLERASGPGTIEVADPATGQHGRLSCREGFQLTTLRNGAPSPIDGDARGVRALQVEAQGPSQRCRFTLRIASPEDWAATTGRPAPAPLTGPPPLPPRLG